MLDKKDIEDIDMDSVLVKANGLLEGYVSVQTSHNNVSKTLKGDDMVAYCEEVLARAIYKFKTKKGEQ